MTPREIAQRNPDWSKIAAGVASAVAGLSVLGFSVMNPKEQLDRYAAEQTKVTERIEAEIRSQGHRIDSVTDAVRKVDAMWRLDCVRAKQQLERTILECK